MQTSFLFLGVFTILLFPYHVQDHRIANFQELQTLKTGISVGEMDIRRSDREEILSHLELNASFDTHNADTPAPSSQTTADHGTSPHTAPSVESVPPTTKESSSETIRTSEPAASYPSVSTGTASGSEPEEDPKIAKIRKAFEYCKEQFPHSTFRFEEYLQIRDRKITVIGDSITVMCSPKIELFFPQAEISAKKSRQTHHADDFYFQMKNEDRIGEAVIVALGTNGTVDFESFRRIQQDIGQTPFILASIILPNPATEKERNDSIYRYQKENPHTFVIPWYESCKHMTEVIYNDGIHPKENSGCLLYAFLLAETTYEALYGKNVSN